DPSNGWLLAQIGRADREWGRLVIAADAPPSRRLITVAERAAATLAVHRLRDRDRNSPIRQVHQELMSGLLTDPGDPALHRRLSVAGIAADQRRYIGLALRPPTYPPGISGASRVDDLVSAAVWAADAVGAP